MTLRKIEVYVKGEKHPRKYTTDTEKLLVPTNKNYVSIPSCNSDGSRVKTILIQQKLVKEIVIIHD